MIIQTDTTCERILLLLKDWFQGGGPLWLKLYRNDPLPGPQRTNPADYVEANFSGYAQVNLNGKLNAPVRFAAGSWYMPCDAATFTHNGGAVRNNVSGWWLQRGSAVVFSDRFLAPVLLEAGSLPLVLMLRLSQKAEAILSNRA